MQCYPSVYFVTSAQICNKWCGSRGVGWHSVFLHHRLRAAHRILPFLSNMTLWGQDTVKDVAESVGIINLNKDVNQALCRDVEYRISQVVEEALKFMRHAKRTILWSQDISQALRVLDVEPLYGYDTTRPLRFGEASIGPGQPLFYVEDEEMDFEKLINAPLPKVPREISFTGELDCESAARSRD